MQSTPQPGDFVRVRSRRWLVEEGLRVEGLNALSLPCIDDDAEGKTAAVLWHAELDATILADEGWANVAKQGTDDPSVFAPRRLSFAFGTAVALCYAIAVGRQLALFTVFPSLGIVLPRTVQSRDVADPAVGFLAPAMYRHGWTTTATLGALAVGVISLAVPET